MKLNGIQNVLEVMIPFFNFIKTSYRSDSDSFIKNHIGTILLTYTYLHESEKQEKPKPQN